jgi:Zn-dependent oligopeptidase
MHVLYKVIVTGLIVAAGGLVLMKQKLYKCCGCSAPEVESVFLVFPMTVTDIQSRAHSAMEQARKDVAAIVSIPNEQRTFENTIRALDTISSNFSIPYVAISTLNYVHPDEKIRAQAEKTEQLMQDFSIDMFGHNVDLYNAFKAYAENNASHESLHDDQKYFITESMKDFKRNGLHLPEEQRNRVAQLKKEIGKLELDFSNNINKDASFIVVSRDGLMGLKDDFIDSSNLL